MQEGKCWGLKITDRDNLDNRAAPPAKTWPLTLAVSAGGGFVPPYPLAPPRVRWPLQIWFGECAERHQAALGKQHPAPAPASAPAAAPAPAPAQRDWTDSQPGADTLALGVCQFRAFGEGLGSPGSAKAAAPLSILPAPVRARACCQTSRATGQPVRVPNCPGFTGLPHARLCSASLGRGAGQGRKQGCSPADTQPCHLPSSPSSVC